MKLSKFRLLTLLTLSGLFLSLSPLVKADDTNTAPAMKGNKDRRAALQKVFEKLNLTPEQKEKVKSVFQAQAEKFRELGQDTSLTKEERRAQFKTIFQNTEAKLKGILTPEQYAKWQELRQGLQKRAEGDAKLPDSEKTPLLPVK